MADGRQMSFPGGLAYTGNNSYSYSYSYAYGSNSYSYSAPETAGIAGFAADPMLSAAIVATRDALLSEVDLPSLGEEGDRRADKHFAGADEKDGLPKMNCARDIAGYGGQVRASLALFDLLSSVSFHVEKDEKKAILKGACLENGKEGVELVTMKRPDRAFFESQLKELDRVASRRDVRAAEILTQVAPPLAYFASLLNLQAGRHRRTLELVNAALQFTYAACMQFKHALACPRPGEYSVGVQAMIEVPMHPSLPGGHAAEAHMTAAVLGALAGAPVKKESKVDQMLRQLAYRISENRVVAGLHFPIDMVAGRLLGDALASYFLARCGRSEQTWTGGEFEIKDTSKGEFSANDENGKRVRFFGPGCQPLPRGRKVLIKESDLLPEMWREAAAEWER